MELKATQLRHFLNVAKSHSFKEAARRSFRSQPAISLALKTLEAQIGAPLLEGGKRVTLTSLGASIVPMIEEFLSHHDRLVRLITQAAEGQSGDISMAANPSIASRWMPSVVRSFAKKHPGVGVYVTDGNSEYVCELVRNGRVDLGLASLRRNYSDIEFTPIWSDSFGVVCRRDHPLNKRGRALQWSQLRDVPIIGNITHSLLEDKSVFVYLSKPRVFMSSLTSLVANVEGGIGVTILPELAAPVNHPEVVFKKLHSPQIMRTVGIIVRRGRILSPQVQVMRDHIIGRFKKSGGFN
jgi:DNA-binding transcriptional LysR family regulator